MAVCPFAEATTSRVTSDRMFDVAAAAVAIFSPQFYTPAIWLYKGSKIEYVHQIICSNTPSLSSHHRAFTSIMGSVKLPLLKCDAVVSDQAKLYICEQHRCVFWNCNIGIESPPFQCKLIFCEKSSYLSQKTSNSPVHLSGTHTYLYVLIES